MAITVAQAQRQIPLLERQQELEALSGAIDGASRGVGAVIALEGEAGIGKSALLAATIERAHSAGMRVLHGRGGELERELAYGVVRQLFEAPLAAAGASERERWLDGAARLATPALAPDEDVGLLRGHSPPAVLHGLYWLSANLSAERPLLVAVDDAHWADDASLGFLSYLARRAGELAILLVYAARPGEGAGELLADWAAIDLADATLRPERLSEGATAELVRALLDTDCSARFARSCRAATAGNPFLLGELIRTLLDDGVAADDEQAARIEHLVPAGIARATLARLRSLGPDAAQLAFAVAVLGTDVELRHAAVVAGLEPEAAGAAADALSAVAILRPERPLEFLHPIVRSTVLAEIPPARRTDSHRRAAELLHREGVRSESLAPHLLASERRGDGWVVEQLRAAAAAALQRGAPEAARTFLERALQEPPAWGERAGVLLELGSAELRAGRESAVEHLGDALAQAGDRAVRVEAAEELTLGLVAIDRGAEAVATLDPVVAEIGQVDREAAMRIDAQLIGVAQVDVATAKLAGERLAHYGSAPPGDTPGQRLLLASLAFDAASRGEGSRRASELARRALDGGRLLAEHRADSPSFSLPVMALVYADHLEEAERHFDVAFADAQDRGSLLGFAVWSGLRSFVLVRQGRLHDAQAEAQSALDATLGRVPVAIPMLVLPLLDAMVERAEPADCEALLRATRTDAGLPTAIMAGTLLHSRGHLRLASGDAAAALRDFDELRRRDDAAGLSNVGAYNVLASAALAQARLGDRDAALAHARDGLAAARRWRAPSTLSVALRALAATEGGPDTVDLLREAVTGLDGSPARYERARALADLGAALRRAGHRRDAREPLREAFDLAERCGASRLAGATYQELLASGARPRRAALTGRDALTASELRVARSAAEGRSNREIAQALFVTVRTVEGHLTHAYRKLGIASRDELAEALDEERTQRTQADAAAPEAPAA